MDVLKFVGKIYISLINITYQEVTYMYQRKSNQYHERAKKILQIIKNEKIYSSSDQIEDFSEKLKTARYHTRLLSSRKMGPGLTACVATTLLKVGLCQELSQRFVLEYLLEYNDQKISLIFLSNPKGHKTEDHVLVFIGPVNVPDQLMVGRGNDGVTISLNNNQKLTKFLDSNQNGCIADPLLDCSGIGEDEIKRLLNYCEEYDVTHVVGVRSFASTPNLINCASQLKQNAVEIAAQTKKDYPHVYKYVETGESKSTSGKKDHFLSLKKGFFQTSTSTFGDVYKSVEVTHKEEIQEVLKEFRESGEFKHN